MKKYLTFVLALMFVLQACGGSPTAEPTEAPAETQVVEAAVTEAPTVEPIVHSVIPQGGTKDRAYAHDNENSTNFENKNVRFGDEFQKNRFERPFTSNDMAYLPDLDIVDFGITSDDQFFYISIILAGKDAATGTLTGIYGVEIDRDADGRAELMLGVLPNYSTEFTAENVVVLADSNGDVGGPTINRPDPGFEGDGFDGIIFDLSQNIHPDDPDLAWVRFVDGNKPSIEIAYRKWIFRGGDEKFMWSVFAQSAEQGLDVTGFYPHDIINETDAGSPDKNNPNYPIKLLAAMDNTCRVPLGFQAIGTEPLGCQTRGSADIAVEEEVADEGGGGGGGGESGAASEFCLQFAEICNRQPPAIPVTPPIFFAIGDPVD